VALAAPAARADGDPASDVLLSEDVFFPFDVKLPPASQTALTQTVLAAKKQGYPIRVALIPQQLDLGVVTPLWKKPQEYAQFLAQELAFVYRGRLLIVMPNGYGLYWCAGGTAGRCGGGRPLTAEKRVLAALPSPTAAGKDVAAAGAVAVRKLAAADGVQLKVAPPAKTSSGGGGSSTSDRLKIVAGALTLLVIAVGIEALRRYRRSRAASA